MTAKIGAHGRRVIEAMEQGRRFVRAGDGWRAGGLLAPDSLIEELRRHDLVRQADGGIALTVAGQGYGIRRARPEAANRILVERALPDPQDTPRKAARRTVTVNLAESPLGWLHARGMVSARQYDAGERLRGDWEMAGLGPRVTMRWDAAPLARGARGPGAAIDPTMAQIAAKRRFEEAMTAAGNGLKDILWRVVCAGEGLEGAEKSLGWPRRAGKLVLLMALDRVADHMGMQ